MLKEKLKDAVQFHKLFQCLVIILSNYKCGVKIDSNFRPEPIFKYQGGGIVNKREIVIGYSWYSNDITCYDDIDPKRDHESKITKEVVEYLLNNFSWKKESIQNEIEEVIPKEIGITKEDLFDMLKKFVTNPYGDPLRSLFEVVS